jgi:hypothetical protein
VKKVHNLKAAESVLLCSATIMYVSRFFTQYLETAENDEFQMRGSGSVLVCARSP